MKKLISSSLAAIMSLALSINVFAAPALENDVLKLNCKSAYLVENDTGKVVYEYNAHEKLPPASVTKIMTMLLTMEAVDSQKINLTDKVTCSERSKAMGGSTMFLDAGEIRTVEELLKGVSVESANDAAVALSEYVSGTEEAFVEKMNERAKELGMNDTHFANCTGLDSEGHYSSAYDIAIMSRELLKHQKILEYTTIWMETISEGRQKEFTLVNRNKMIKSYNGCDGLKTGFTEKSKYCISSTAKRNNIRFISVIMGAPSWKERNEMAGRLLDYGFAKYESVNVIKKGDVLGEIEIPKSKPEKVNAVAKEDLNIIVEKGKKTDIKTEIDINKNLKLPINKDDVVGKVKAIDGNTVCGEANIVAENDIKKMNFGDIFDKQFSRWINVK